MNIKKILCLTLIGIGMFIGIIECKANKCQNGGCGIGAESGAKDKTYNEMVPSTENMVTSGGRSYVRLQNEKTGEEIYLFNSEEDRNAMVNCGFATCLDSTKTALLSDIGLPNVDMYNEDTQSKFTDAVKQLQKDFVTYDDHGKPTINPNTASSDFFKYFYGDDLDAAAKKLQETGSLVDLLFYPGYVMYDKDPYTGGYKFLDGSTTDQYKSWCEKYKQQKEMCNAVNKTSGYFNDNGCMTPNKNIGCLVEKMAEGLTLAEAEEKCFGKPPEEPKNPNPVKPSTCQLKVDVAERKPEVPRNTDTDSGGTCGSTYSSINYDYSETTGCGMAIVETSIYTSIQLPSVKGNVFAGQGFNWNDITSNKSVTKHVHDTTALDYEFEKANVIINNNKYEIEYYNCLIDELRNDIYDLKDDLSDCDYNCEEQKTEEDKEKCEESESSCDNDNEPIREAIRSKEDEIAEHETTIEKLKNDPKVQQAVARKKELEVCQTQVDSYGVKPSNYTNTATSSNETMTIGKYTQEMDTIIAIAKNSGLPLTQKDVNNIKNEAYIENRYNFFVPSFIANNETGVVSRHVSDDYIDFSYQCDLKVNNFIKCGSNCKGGLNLIFRPISLTNPFPNTVSSGNNRDFGANWSQSLSDSYIKNNRNVSDYEVYNLKPIYTIVLTPSTIKDIRKYNKGKSYTDFKNMNCTNGYKCSSNFLWNDFYEIIDMNNSCATSSGWSAC